MFLSTVNALCESSVSYNEIKSTFHDHYRNEVNEDPWFLPNTLRVLEALVRKKKLDVLTNVIYVTYVLINMIQNGLLEDSSNFIIRYVLRQVYHFLLTVPLFYIAHEYLRLLRYCQQKDEFNITQIFGGIPIEKDIITILQQFYEEHGRIVRKLQVPIKTKTFIEMFYFISDIFITNHIDLLFLTDYLSAKRLVNIFFIFQNLCVIELQYAFTTLSVILKMLDHQRKDAVSRHIFHISQILYKIKHSKFAQDPQITTMYIQILTKLNGLHRFEA